MAMMLKYRIHEVAKDFKTTSKVISEIMTKYFTAPKNHMQVLEREELDVIFERLTQDHQMESLQELYADIPEKKGAPSPETKPEAAAVPAPAKTEEPAKPAGDGKPAQTKPAGQPAQMPQNRPAQKPA